MITGGVGDFLTFLWCVVLGAALCVLYDLCKSIRLAVRLRGVPLFILDFLYFILAAVLTFFMMLVRCFGEVRWFVLGGELLGFILMRLLCREHFSRLLAHWIKERLIAPIRRWTRRMFGRIIAGVCSLIKKLAELLKKVLRPVGKLLYNPFIRFFSRSTTNQAQTGRLKKQKRFGWRNSR